MRVFSKEIIWINNFCIHLYYLKVSWFMWMQRSVILTPTEHEFRNEVIEELKRAARKYATKSGTLLSCGLVHLQDQMFRRPAMGSSHDLSSFLLTGVRNCGWKMIPCWFCYHHFENKHIGDDLTMATSGEYVSFVFNWWSSTEMPPGALSLTLEFPAGS